MSSYSFPLTFVRPPGCVQALPPRPTNASIVDGSTPSSLSMSSITPLRNGTWSFTCGNLRRTDESWKRLFSKTDVSFSNRLTFVEVEPGFITNSLYLSLFMALTCGVALTPLSL